MLQLNVEGEYKVMNKKIAVLFLLIFVAGTFTGCRAYTAQKSAYQPKISSSTVSSELQNAKEDKNRVYLKDSTDSAQNQLNGVSASYTFLPSYYARQLSKSESTIYYELLDGIKSFETEITITNPCSQNEIQKIMKILTLDTPETFNIKLNYSYKCDTNGNVYLLIPQYSMSNSQYQIIQNKVIEQQTEFIKNCKNNSQTEFEIEKDIINDIETQLNYEYNLTQKDTSNTYSILPLEQIDNFTHKASMLGIAKYFEWLSRSAGIDSAVEFGQYIGNGYSIQTTAKNQKIQIPKFHPYQETVTDKNDVYTICQDISGLYVWNVIKINKNWYNQDNIQTFLADREFPIVQNNLATINMPDTLASISKLSYYNEDVLGFAPSASSFNKYGPTTILQKGNHTLHCLIVSDKKTENEIYNSIEEILFNEENQEKLSNQKIYLQFETEKQYKDFLSKIKNLSNELTKIGKIKIANCNSKTYDDICGICLSNFIESTNSK